MNSSVDLCALILWISYSVAKLSEIWNSDKVLLDKESILLHVMLKISRFESNVENEQW